MLDFAHHARMCPILKIACFCPILLISPNFTWFYPIKAYFNYFFTIIFNFDWFYKIEPDFFRLGPNFFRFFSDFVYCAGFYQITLQVGLCGEDVFATLPRSILWTLIFFLQIHIFPCRSENMDVQKWISRLQRIDLDETTRGNF